MTAPLRKLLIKDAVFKWDEESDASFQTLIRMMNSRTYLAPHDHTRKTHLVTDASPSGIAASVYQEDDAGTWVPVDHTSRALSAVEQGWQSQIDWESLAKTWGMEMFRPYLVGVRFTSWGDHKPLLPLYNDMTKTAPVRVTRHRNKVQDLRFTDKYLEGKAMPCNYASRHAAPIEGLNEEEQERLMVDNGEDIQVMRVYIDDLPPALSLETLREVAAQDTVYQELMEAVKKGRKPTDRSMIPYMSVWKELGVLEGLLCRGEKIVIPEGRHKDHDVELRDWVVDLGHSAHQGGNTTKRQLRLRLWSPRDG